MTAEGVQQAAKSAKQLTLREAEMILGLESGATWADVMKASGAGRPEPGRECGAVQCGAGEQRHLGGPPGRHAAAVVCGACRRCCHGCGC